MKSSRGKHLILILVCLLPIFTATIAQLPVNKPSAVRYLLQHIASWQIKEGNSKGLFPSLREYHYRPGTYKEDDNIFFTALIIWTLRRQRPFLPEEDRTVADTIIERASSAYDNFQNAGGRPTYNFWRTKPPEIFPNGGWLNFFNKAQALPDDIDDTAIALMAMNADSAVVAEVHRIMQNFANDGSHALAAPAHYRGFNAYSTWFGKKMPVDLDACVLSNVLFVASQYRIAWSSADSASMNLLIEMVRQKDYLRMADLISPHYQKGAVILYHLARLMEVNYDARLANFKPQLIEDAMRLYDASNDLMDKILLSSALIRWGASPPLTTMNFRRPFESVIEESHFVFFVANMASMFRYPFNKFLGRSGIGRFNYYCPAYNFVLILENLLLAKRGR